MYAERALSIGAEKECSSQATSAGAASGGDRNRARCQSLLPGSPLQWRSVNLRVLAGSFQRERTFPMQPARRPAASG